VSRETGTATPVRPAAPSRWRAVALALVIFVSGAVAGAAVSLTLARRATLSALRRPELVPARLAARMRTRLHLTPDQETAVARIIATRQAAWLAVRRSVRPQVEAELEGLRSDVAAVLDPQQALAWNRWFGRLRGRWEPREEPLPAGERQTHR
jgi:hypothetical protein